MEYIKIYSLCVHVKTLEEAIFNMQLKDSSVTQYYQHCPNFPFHGSGQGSANSPTIWVFISSQLFTAHHNNAHRMIFQTPDGSTKLRVTIIGFVDDSPAMTSGKPALPVQDLIDTAQKEGQLWADLLYDSGGKLVISKCGCQII